MVAAKSEKKKGSSRSVSKDQDMAVKKIESWRNYNNLGANQKQAQQRNPEKQPHVDFNMEAFDHDENVDNIEIVSKKDRQEAKRKNDQKQLLQEQHQINIEQAPTRSDPNIDLNWKLIEMLILKIRLKA